MNQLDRYRGCLLGLAVGDALGTTLEFKPPGSFAPLDDMAGGGPFGLEPGQWTDDTSLALCLAESLVERKSFDPVDQLERYLSWRDTGHLSSTGTCFDIGVTTSDAISRFKRTREPFPGPTDPYSAGNGSIMRLAAIPMFFAANPAEALRISGQSSKTTHGATEAVDGCRYFGGLLVGALCGVSKDELLSAGYSPVDSYWTQHPLSNLINEVAQGSFKYREPPDIQGQGYVVRSLEAALWAFDRSDSYREGCLMAANLGDDADTTAAVYGQLAGAYYGESGIPDDWRSKIALRSLIEDFADRLYSAAQGIQPG